MTDPIADMLTRIRNAQAARHAEVRIPASKLKKAVLDVLVANKFLAGADLDESGSRPVLVAKLDSSRKLTLTRRSKPGQRIYRASAELKPVLQGLGIAVVSTSQGVMTHIQAKKAGIGGEVICEIY